MCVKWAAVRPGSIQMQTPDSPGVCPHYPALLRQPELAFPLSEDGPQLSQSRLLARHRLRTVDPLTCARLRRRCVRTAVGVVVSVGAFDRDGLRALALLRSRCARSRTIERRRPITAGKSRSGERSGSGNQHSSDKFGLHDDSSRRFGFRFRKASRQGPGSLPPTLRESVYSLTIKNLYPIIRNEYSLH